MAGRTYMPRKSSSIVLKERSLVVIEFIAAITVPLLVGYLSGRFTQDSISVWYHLLDKPFFTPPDYVFAPVWTILYLFMGVSAFMVMRQGLDKDNVQYALSFFILQLMLNGIWSFMFFTMRSLFFAFVELVVLLGALLLTYMAFRRISVWAGYLLIPYIIWVIFAGALNLSIAILNHY